MATVADERPDDFVEPPPSGETNRWLVLVIVSLAQFMVILDASVVNVALPSIQADLGFSAANLPWVITSYTLIFGGFLLLGGALVSPAALSIITTTFADGDDRTKALGVWRAIAAGGGALGLLLGGVLTDLLSWEWIFLVNVPIGIATAALALRYVPESRARLDSSGVDLAGAITVTAGLLMLVYVIAKAENFGWGSARTLGLAAIAFALLAAFVYIERTSKAPLIRLGIFRVC